MDANPLKRKWPIGSLSEGPGTDEEEEASSHDVSYDMGFATPQPRDSNASSSQEAGVPLNYETLLQRVASLEEREKQLDKREATLARQEEYLESLEERLTGEMIAALEAQDKVGALPSEVLEDDAGETPVWDDPVKAGMELFAEVQAEDEEGLVGSQVDSDGTFRAEKPVIDGETGMVDTFEWIFWNIMSAISGLHQRYPACPMFMKPGQPHTVGVISLPYVVDMEPCPTGKNKGLLRKPSNSVDWEEKAKDIARNVRTYMGDRIHIDSCWLTQGQYLELQIKNEHYWRVNKYRWLAFLRKGSERSWEFFERASRGDAVAIALANRTPFCHSCNNGHGSEKNRTAEWKDCDQAAESVATRFELCSAKADAAARKKQQSWNSQLRCVNGLYHGILADVTVNNTFQVCTKAGDKTRATCPGHGVKLTKCHFVWLVTGFPKVCRNAEPPIDTDDCECSPNCYS